MPQAPQPLTKEYLLSQVSEIQELSIESSDDKGLVVWDDEDAKLLPVHFPEAMTVDDLVQRIHISSDIPEWYRADKKALAEYLWNACDHNAFITLEEIVVVWSELDNAETLESSDFEDEQRKRLYEEYSDECASEIGEGRRGRSSKRRPGGHRPVFLIRKPGTDRLPYHRPPRTPPSADGYEHFPAGRHVSAGACQRRGCRGVLQRGV